MRFGRVFGVHRSRFARAFAEGRAERDVAASRDSSAFSRAGADRYSNPPGNEARIVEYLEKVLASDGIPSERFALDPNRPNLVARLKGNGSKRPVLMLAHTDVVGVQRDKWPVDPFGAVLRDGYVWGRGTTDDKDNLAASLMTLLLIKRSGQALDRDVIFLAESGEEADPTGVGIRFMVDRHFEAIEAEFAIAEGNGATIEDGRVRTVQIATTEKVRGACG